MIDDPSGDSVAELRGRTPSPWLLLGSVLFVLAFVLGWRSAAGPGKAPEATPGELPA